MSVLGTMLLFGAVLVLGALLVLGRASGEEPDGDTHAFLASLFKRVRVLLDIPVAAQVRL